MHPHTASGAIVVDGFVVSCYTSVAPGGLVDRVLWPAHALRGLLRALLRWGEER